MYPAINVPCLKIRPPNLEVKELENTGTCAKDGRRFYSVSYDKNIQPGAPPQDLASRISERSWWVGVGNDQRSRLDIYPPEN